MDWNVPMPVALAARAGARGLASLFRNATKKVIFFLLPTSQFTFIVSDR
jgi:hypothetical protein